MKNMSPMIVSQKKVKFFNKNLISWSNQFRRNFSWREERTPYKVLIAEILLKRTTSKAAARIFDQFIEKYPTIFILEQADVSELEFFLKPLGLNQQRSIAIKESTKYIIDTFNGEFPRKYDELLKIPSVGPYSAACILSFGMNICKPTIDSNAIRLLTRFFYDFFGDTPTYREIFSFACKIIPKTSHTNFNYGLIDFGAIICSYRGCKGNCCPLNDICSFFAKEN
jgi:A/G-specific adenine glycosylase